VYNEQAISSNSLLKSMLDWKARQYVCMSAKTLVSNALIVAGPFPGGVDDPYISRLWIAGELARSIFAESRALPGARPTHRPNRHRLHGRGAGKRGEQRRFWRYDPRRRRLLYGRWVVACSHVELTAAGRPHIRNNCYTCGVDAHQSRGWVVRDNVVEGFWCANGLSEHGIHFWTGSRDTVVERNLLRDNARGVGFGLVVDGNGRIYADDGCPAAGDDYVDHYGGVIRNNFVVAFDGELFSSEFGFDCGICLWNACDAGALHNTVYTFDTANTFSAIAWRFPNTQAEIANNLVNDALFERDGAGATQAGNLANAQPSWFVDAASGDLHLAAVATAAIDQAVSIDEVTGDYDGDLRPAGPAPDVGADEYGGTPFEPTSFVYMPAVFVELN